MKFRLILLLMLLAPVMLLAQLPGYLQKSITYPVFDQDPYVGVIATEFDALKYDPKLDYKIVIDIYDEIPDSTRVTNEITEAMRTYNLNIANGVPEKKLKMALVFHAFGMSSILTDEAYTKMYGVANPNTPFIKAMHDKGIKMYVCSQSLAFMQIPQSDMAAEIEIAVSAKTALITLDQLGYTYMNNSED